MPALYRDGNRASRTKFSFALEPELLVRRRRRHVRDEPDGGLRDAGPERADAGLLPERRVHDLFVDSAEWEVLYKKVWPDK